MRREEDRNLRDLIDLISQAILRTAQNRKISQNWSQLSLRRRLKERSVKKVYSSNVYENLEHISFLYIIFNQSAH